MSYWVFIPLLLFFRKDLISSLGEDLRELRKQFGTVQISWNEQLDLDQTGF